jgi:hypothetical protein
MKTLEADALNWRTLRLFSSLVTPAAALAFSAAPASAQAAKPNIVMIV